MFSFFRPRPEEQSTTEAKVKQEVPTTTQPIDGTLIKEDRENVIPSTSRDAEEEVRVAAVQDKVVYENIGDIDIDTSIDEEEDSIDNTLTNIRYLLSEEKALTSCYNYLTSSNTEVDDSCRKAMINWVYNMQRALKLSSETSYIAVSFLDRYLSCGRGKSSEALEDKYTFQLATIASFYIAVKLYTEVELNVVTLARLCKGYYSKSAILDMEEDINEALNFPSIKDFRMEQPTAMRFVHQFVRLLPDHVDEESLLLSCEKKIEYVTTDIYFSVCLPSVVGASCLTYSLLQHVELSPEERKQFYVHLSKYTNLVEVMEAENRLIACGSSKPTNQGYEC